MSEHQGGAGGAPDRGPGTEERGHGGSPDTWAREQAPRGAGGGYGEAPTGSATGQAQTNPPASGQAGGVAGGLGGQGAFQGYGPDGTMGGVPPGSGLYGAAGVMPPPPWSAQYAPPAPGQGYPGYPGDVRYAPLYYGHAVGYPPPPPPDAFQMQHPGYAHGASQGAGHAHGASMSDLVNEVANGGNGLSTLGKLLNVDDPDFWKGALVGAAAVLLLTSDAVQNALFGANGNGGKESDA